MKHVREIFLIHRVMGDDVKDKLLTNNEECTVNLINLLAIIIVSVYY